MRKCEFRVPLELTLTFHPKYQENTKTDHNRNDYSDNHTVNNGDNNNDNNNDDDDYDDDDDDDDD